MIAIVLIREIDVEGESMLKQERTTPHRRLC